MNPTQVRIAGTALFFLLIFIFGFWLSRSGKPYNGILFNLHKLIALGAVVFLGLTALKVHQTTPLDRAQVAVLAIATACFLVAMVTGGLLSALKDVPATVTRVHRVIPYLVLALTGGSLYLLLIKGSQVIAAP